MRFNISHEAQLVGYYELDPMPGCKAVGVSHGLYIYPEYRDKGYASTAHKQRLLEARRQGYEILIATTQVSNAKQTHLLSKNGWKLARGFLNHKTGNDLSFWYIHLTDPYRELHEVGV